MKAQDMQNLRAGFAHESFGSQAVFRTALQAMSHPGRLWEVTAESELPQSGHAAAALLLLALLDSDCTAWISDSLRATDAVAWLEFHTGCRWARDARQANFLWVGLGDELPDLGGLLLGTDAYPDQSSTCVIEVDQLHSINPPGASGWTLQGPGIATELGLDVPGLPSDFVQQWARNHDSFPRGVDLFLATPSHLVGLPRTTRIRCLQET